MTRPKIFFVLGMALVPTLLAFAGHMGETTTRQYQVQNGRVSYAGSRTSSNDNGDVWNAEMCWGSACRPCGNCHTRGLDRSREVFTMAKHDNVYYPAATVPLREGAKMPLGDGGILGALGMKNGQILYYSRAGTVHMIAPTGSRILKDRAGAPFMVHMPGTPVLK